MYHNLETKPFLDTDFNQDIDQNKIMDSLKFIHKNYAFSTFPYLVHCNNSKNAINNFKSGNCISLSIGLKNYLKEYYNVESFLIPATIPNMYSRDDYLDISHVALAIPRNKKKIYIADCAFYFINPIKATMSTNRSRSKSWTKTAKSCIMLPLSMNSNNFGR